MVQPKNRQKRTHTTPPKQRVSNRHSTPHNEESRVKIRNERVFENEVCISGSVYSRGKWII